MTNRGIEKLVDEWEPRIRRAFLQSVSRIADAAQIGIIEDKLRRGDVDGALDAVGLDPAQFRALDAAVAGAFESGGNYQAGQLPALKRAGAPIVKVLFDIRNPRAEEWLKRASGTLIREIIADQRDMARQHMAAGMLAGQNPRTVALDLVGRIAPNGKRQGGAIGLTASQEGWVRNFRAELSDPKTMPQALARAMRDKRFDRTIAKAIKDGKPLAADKIDAMVTAYRNRALKMRGDAIGRTEAIRALNAAQEEATWQAIDKGQMNEAAVSKVWVATGDKRTRDTHREMDGQERGFTAEFVSPSGARLRYPGDERAPPAETINCRCTVFYRTNVYAGLK